ncbi:hypothetical protein [Pseudomonas sp. NC02]|uniref:hypothetical protein n=1 Tax=Pseudomonas sp. NC02 TaxID=2067572 RepID=UPI000C845606|nr:hypothetical protein [Pseudomonas sp. NC02]AUO22502.1 hypothetical protein C0058_11050 [Pseudomonas sp. NC02]
MQIKLLKPLAITLALSSATLIPQTSQAETKFAISGIGASSCGKFMKPPKGQKEFSDALTVTWLQGYLSGTNTQRYIESQKAMKVQPDSESMTAFVEKFCRDNPLKTVYDAAILLDLSY